MTDTVRQAFARYMDDRYGPGYPARYGLSGWHECDDFKDDWAAWLASRAAALEDAARVCDHFSDPMRRGDFALGAETCADAIRILALVKEAR